MLVGLRSAPSRVDQVWPGSWDRTVGLATASTPEGRRVTSKQVDGLDISSHPLLESWAVLNPWQMSPNYADVGLCDGDQGGWPLGFQVAQSWRIVAISVTRPTTLLVLTLFALTLILRLALDRWSLP